MCVCVCACSCVWGRRGEEYHLSVTFCMSSNVPCLHTQTPFTESRCNLAEQGLASFYEQGNYRLKWLVMVLPKIIPQRLSWIQT